MQNTHSNVEYYFDKILLPEGIVNAPRASHVNMDIPTANRYTNTSDINIDVKCNELNHSSTKEASKEVLMYTIRNLKNQENKLAEQVSEMIHFDPINAKTDNNNNTTNYIDFIHIKYDKADEAIAKINPHTPNVQQLHVTDKMEQQYNILRHFFNNIYNCHADIDSTSIFQTDRIIMSKNIPNCEYIITTRIDQSEYNLNRKEKFYCTRELKAKIFLKVNQLDTL